MNNASSISCNDASDAIHHSEVEDKRTLSAADGIGLSNVVVGKIGIFMI